MVLDCNSFNDIINSLSNKTFISFYRGSRLYKNHNENSDYDFGMIVPNDTEFIDIEDNVNSEKADRRLHNGLKMTMPNTSGSKSIIDVQYVREEDFIEMIKEHTPFALEAIFSNNPKVSKYKEHFVLDTWKLRESFGSVANNSWSKAHKKMTVEADLDMYCGAKSLYHSIRLQKLACQIASGNDSIDFTECNDLWNTIKEELESGKDWEYFKEKYKPIYNEAHSEMVKVCPKPEEKYKKSKKKVESNE